MRKFILIAVLLLTVNGFSQKVTVQGKITDYQGEPVRSAKVEYGKNHEDFTASRVDGGYSFEINLENLSSVSFLHVAHEVKTIVIGKRLIRKIKNDTLTLNVRLNDIEFKEIVVGVKKPEVVFGTQNYSVADFQAIEDKKLVLLTYEKNLKKGAKLRLVDSSSIELDSYVILDECIDLRLDYRKNIHLVTTENVYLVQILNNRFYVYREDKAYYYKYLASVVDTLNDRLYYSNYSEIYPAFDYMEFNKTDSVYKKMLEVKDEPLMEQYRAEFKFTDVRTKLWAHNKEIETGIDKEVWVGAAVFTNTVYYTPLYAPLFVQNDSVFVFDHYDNKLKKYTPVDGVVSSVEIDYHFNSRKSGWEQPLIQDKEGGKIYAVFMRDGFTFISLLDTNTGEIVKTYKLFYKYIEKIQIVNNEVFYIYRPYESIQKKYIYKEKLASILR